MDADIVITFGIRVMIMRKNHGWTVQYLADKAGISRNALSMIENDKGNPTLSTIIALARALRTTPSRLLDGVQ